MNSTQAIAAIIAAGMRHQIGRDASMRLFINLAGRENLPLFRLACQLRAAS